MPLATSILRAPQVAVSVTSPNDPPSSGARTQARVPAGQPGGGRFYRQPIPLPESRGGPSMPYTPLPKPPPRAPQLPQRPISPGSPTGNLPQGVPGNLPTQEVNRLRQLGSPLEQRQLEKLQSQMQRQAQELRATSAAYDRATRPPVPSPKATPAPQDLVNEAGKFKKFLGLGLKIVATVLGGYAAYKIVTQSKSVGEFLVNSAKFAADVIKNRIAGPTVYLAKEILVEGLEPLTEPATVLTLEYLFGSESLALAREELRKESTPFTGALESARVKFFEESFEQFKERLNVQAYYRAVDRAASNARFYDLILSQVEAEPVSGPVRDC